MASLVTTANETFKSVLSVLRLRHLAGSHVTQRPERKARNAAWRLKSH